MYLARSEPLGLHNKALKYLLEARGNDPLHNFRLFCLWRVSIFRLQARQLLLGEDGGEGGGAFQQTLLDSLNQERPDLRVMYHVSQIIHLCSKIDQLRHNSWQEADVTALAQITNLLEEIRKLISSIESWTSTLDKDIKPTPVMSDLTSRFERMTTFNEDTVDTFQCPIMLKYHDITLAFLWSFYAAAQIILRDHTIQILRLAASLSQNNAQQYIDRTRGEELAIDGLSSSIIRSFPHFMGFEVDASTDIHPRERPSQASSLGRFLGVFAMFVVKKTEATSKAHKQHAEKVLGWLRTHYRIG